MDIGINGKRRNGFVRKDEYNKIFMEVFMLDDVDETLSMENLEEWDSVGHMMLITAVEDAFDIMLDADDIVSFDSYEKGIEILKKYDVELE